MASPDAEGHGEDEDADVVEEDDAHEGVHVVLQVAGGGVLLGDVVPDVDAGMDEALHEPVEERAEECADEEADGDVAQIVHAEVEAGEGGGERPEDEGDGDLGAAEEPGEEHGDAHGVAGMAGEESEASAAVVFHHVNQVHELGVLGGSPARHHGLDHAGADAVGHEDEQGDGDIDHDGFLPGVVPVDDDEQDDDDERPREGVRDGVHHVVPEDAVAAVDGEGQLVVEFVDIVHS